MLHEQRNFFRPLFERRGAESSTHAPGYNRGLLRTLSCPDQCAQVLVCRWGSGGGATIAHLIGRNVFVAHAPDLCSCQTRSSFTLKAQTGLPISRPSESCRHWFPQTAAASVSSAAGGMRPSQCPNNSLFQNSLGKGAALMGVKEASLYCAVRVNGA